MDDDELVAHHFHNTVAEGKLRQAVRQITNRDGGGILQPKEPDTKTGRRVVDMLSDKHPAIRIPDLGLTDWASFEAYDTCADPIPLPVDGIGDGP